MKQALKRDEVLDFVSKKYLMYAWSLRTGTARPWLVFFLLML